MTETRHETTTDDEFDPHRLRTITDMRRSRDDRVVAGVCSGAARYLNVDPIVIRVVVAVLTFVGLAGLILYVAAWLLLPAEGEQQSIVADWFNLDKNEERVRVGGLVAATVLAALAVIGDGSWAWWGLGWILLPLAALYWLFVVRPSRQDDHPPAVEAQAVGTDTLVLDSGDEPLPKQRRPRRRRSWALTGLTVSATAIAMAVMMIFAETNDEIAWTTYVAVGLGIVAVGTLVGTFVGHPGPLVLLGILLAAVLVIGSMVPNGSTGQRTVTPGSAAAVDSVYEHGAGEFELDLTNVGDAEQLLGRTVWIDTGWGEARVIVPDELNVSLDAQVDAGEIRAFGRKTNGTDAALTLAADDPEQPALTLRIRQTFGGVEVIER